MWNTILYYLGIRTHKFAVGDRVIYVNDFGVVFLWTISELTTWTRHTGEVVPAYHHEGSQTPWFPTEQKLLKRAKRSDLKLSYAELQKKYGFKPTEWFGCY